MWFKKSSVIEELPDVRELLEAKRNKIVKEYTRYLNHELPKVLRSAKLTDFPIIIKEHEFLLLNLVVQDLAMRLKRQGYDISTKARSVSISMPVAIDHWRVGDLGSIEDKIDQL